MLALAAVAFINLNTHKVMGSFNRGARFGDRKSGGGFNRRDAKSRGFSRRDDSGGRSAMHRAICDACGQACEVPFRPTGDKPVYCSNCFGQDAKGRDKRASGDSSSKQFDHQLQIINEKLDRILQSLPAAAAKIPAAKQKDVVKAEAKNKISFAAEPENKAVVKTATRKKTIKVSKAKTKAKKK